MSSVAVIGDIDTVSGFRLGGVKKAEVVNTSEEAIAAFDKFLNNDEISIIIGKTFEPTCLLMCSLISLAIN